MLLLLLLMWRRRRRYVVRISLRAHVIPDQGGRWRRIMLVRIMVLPQRRMVLIRRRRRKWRCWVHWRRCWPVPVLYRLRVGGRMDRWILVPSVNLIAVSALRSVHWRRCGPVPVLHRLRVGGRMDRRILVPSLNFVAVSALLQPPLIPPRFAGLLEGGTAIAVIARGPVSDPVLCTVGVGRRRDECGDEGRSSHGAFLSPDQVCCRQCIAHSRSQPERWVA